MAFIALDAAGHRRSPATMPGYHQGRTPRNKGMRYPADPPTIEEIVAVMRAAGEKPDGLRLRALIVLLWRAGLRVGEALALAETDLDRSRGAVLVRRGKGGKRREVGTDRWAWQQLDPWLELRPGLPVGALLCVIHGATSGRHWEASATRKQLKRRRNGWCPAAVRPTPAPTRSRDRDGSRGDPAGGDPAAARARQPRHHVDLSPRDRQLRDHRHRPCPPCANDQRYGRARQAVIPRPPAVPADRRPYLRLARRGARPRRVASLVFRVSTGNAQSSSAERVATTESFAGVRSALGRRSGRSG